ncbi:MAG: hypothetical protein WCT18_03980, partial [Patescibacteria group bacterium]
FSKKILLSFIIVVAFLTGTIFWSNHHKKNLVLETAYREQIQKAKDLINRSQVSLITRNEADSLKFISEAMSIIEQLPKESNSQKTNYDDLTKQTQTINDKLQKIEKIVPELVVEISNGTTPVVLKNIGWQNGNLLATDERIIFEVNPDKKTSSTKPTQTPANINKIIFDDKNLLFALDNQTLAKIDNSGLATAKINWQGFSGMSINIYNGNIYAVDEATKQIYKYAGIDGTSFGTKTNWLKELGSADLTGAISLAFDGNMFVGTNSGNIYKFFTGKNQPFTNNSALTKNLQKIHTLTELDNLYVLTKDSKKIIILSKEGQLIAQYEFDSLSGNIIDFTVNKDALYVITENKIYKAKK